MGKYVALFAKKELGHKELKVSYFAAPLKKNNNNIVGSRFQIFQKSNFHKSRTFKQGCSSQLEYFILIQDECYG